jgi:hypothetical protein
MQKERLRTKDIKIEENLDFSSLLLSDNILALNCNRVFLPCLVYPFSSPYTYIFTLFVVCACEQTWKDC